MPNNNIEISDHAAIRYLERVMGINVKQQMMDQVLDDGMTAMILYLGDGTFPIGEGYKLVIKGKVVVTVL